MPEVKDNMTDHWSETPICHLMHRPLMISSHDPVDDAVTKLQDPQAHCLLVLDDEDKLLGLFTEEIVVNRVIDEGTIGNEPVSQFIEKDFFSLSENATVGQVIDLMGHQRLRYLPLMGEDGKPKGIFSVRSLISYIVSKSTTSDRVTTIDGEEDRAFGSLQKAMAQVLNLPIHFALSSHGYNKVIRLSKEESIGKAIKKFKGSGHLGGLVFESGDLVGLFRVRDIPFKSLHEQGSMDMPVAEIMTRLPDTLQEGETLGVAIRRMAKAGVLFLHYRNPEQGDSLIPGIGLISYIYDHIYEDE